MNRQEREYLRGLAKKQLEYANTPENKEREVKWYAHNDLKTNDPRVTMEIEGNFYGEVKRPLQCETQMARVIEEKLLINLIAREDVDDDRVTPDFYGVYRHAWFNPYGLEIKQTRQLDSLAYVYVHQIEDLEEDFHKLGKSTWGYDLEQPQLEADIAADTIGDILPVRFLTRGPYGSLAFRLIGLMSMETMLLSLMDCPDLFHKAMDMLATDLIEHLQDLESSGFFLVNNRNQYVNMGTYAFTNELPSEPALLKNTWGFLDAQECVGIGYDSFNTFFFPYYKRIADLFGRLNYGCCEQVHELWDGCLSKLTNLRKVSISSWCDENFMGERLRGSKVIYHRKPSPLVVSSDKVFDEAKFKDHITTTLKAAEGCYLEFSFRDVYSFQKEVRRGKRCVELVKQCISEHWR